MQFLIRYVGCIALLAYMALVILAVSALGAAVIMSPFYYLVALAHWPFQVISASLLIGGLIMAVYTK